MQSRGADPVARLSITVIAGKHVWHIINTYAQSGSHADNVVAREELYSAAFVEVGYRQGDPVLWLGDINDSPDRDILLATMLEAGLRDPLAEVGKRDDAYESGGRSQTRRGTAATRVKDYR